MRTGAADGPTLLDDVLLRPIDTGGGLSQTYDAVCHVTDRISDLLANSTSTTHSFPS